MTHLPWLRRHPLLGYFALTYGISYALALLTLPVLMLAVLWPFSLMADPAFAPRFGKNFW